MRFKTARNSYVDVACCVVHTSDLFALCPRLPMLRERAQVPIGLYWVKL